MTQTFHRYVETVSRSNHLAIRTWGPSPPRFEGGRSVPPGLVTLKFLTPSEVAAVMLNVAVIVVELTTVEFVTMMLG